jgi:hypothetical protein
MGVREPGSRCCDCRWGRKVAIGLLFVAQDKPRFKGPAREKTAGGRYTNKKKQTPRPQETVSEG